MKNFEEMFVQEMRKKFQDTNSRMSMMILMAEEIRLQEMQRRRKSVSFMEAMETLTEEFNDAKNALLARERNAIMGKFMKDMGL